MYSEQEKKQTLLILGASGRLGKHLIGLLDVDEYNIIALFREYPSLELEQVTIQIGDLESIEKWAHLLTNVDVVINCSGYTRDDQNAYLINTTLPLKLLRLAIRSSVKHWIQISTVGVYGYPHKGYITEKTSIGPKGYYQTSKASFEGKLTELCSKNNKTSCTILRLSTLYDHNHYTKHLRFIKHIYALRHIPLFRRIIYPLNYIHLNDAAMSIIACLHSSRKSPKVYNVSNYLDLPNSYLGYKACILWLESSIFDMICTISAQYPGSRRLLSSKFYRRYLYVFFQNVCYSNQEIYKDLRWSPNISIHDELIK